MIGIFILRCTRFDDGTVGLHPSDFHIGQKIATGSDCRFPTIGKNDGLSIFDQGDFTSFDKKFVRMGKVGHRLGNKRTCLRIGSFVGGNLQRIQDFGMRFRRHGAILFACEYAEYAFVVADKPSGKLFSVIAEKTALKPLIGISMEKQTLLTGRVFR